jgi:hypothetical protein
MGEGIVQRRFEVIKIAEQAGHGGKKLPRLRTIEGEPVAAADCLHTDRRGGACASFASVGLQLAVKPHSLDWWVALPIYYSASPEQPAPLHFAGIPIDSQ